MTDDMPKLPASFGGFIVEAIVFLIKAVIFIVGIVMVGGFGVLGLFCTLAGLTKHNGGLFVLIGLVLLALAFAIGYLFKLAAKK